MEVLDLFGSSLLIIGKVVISLFLFMYIIFAGVVVKQVMLMIDTLDVGLSGLMKLIAVGHFAFAIFVFVTAILIL
jgi:Family of unknown function (DUF5657)